MPNNANPPKLALHRRATTDALGTLRLEIPELPPGTPVEIIILAEPAVPLQNPPMRKAPAQIPSDDEVSALLDAADAERARLFP